MSNQIKGTLNRVEVIGWLGGDPTQRFLASGAGVCDFSIATKRFGPRNDQAEPTIETEWINIEAWDRVGDMCQDRLHKGSRVLVEGSLRTRVWEDKETGERRSRTVVRADNVLFLNDQHRDDE